MAKKQTIDLPPPQNKILQKILRQQIPNKTVWAFGSRVEWKASETSDLDLVAHKCSGAEIAELKEALEESALLCSVDVLNWEDIPDSFRVNIKKHYVVVQQSIVHEGWRKVKLGGIAEIVTGKTPPTARKELYGYRYPFITPSDIKDSSRFCKPARYLSEAGKEYQLSIMNPPNSICYTCIASIGKICLTTEDSFTNQQINVVKPNPTIADTLFIFYYLKYITPKIKSIAGGSIAGIVNKSVFSNIDLYIPPLPEQKAIAEVLSNLDDHIYILGQVIEKKRMIRQGMMQQLLTRKVRLPGFSGEWSLKKIKDIGILYSGLIGKTKSDFGSGSYYITFLNVIENTVINHDKLGQVIVKLNENQNIVQKEDLIFNASSETPNEIGMCAAVINIPKENVYLNSFCFGFRPRDNTKSDSLYLAYYFRSGEGRKLLKFLSQGSTRYNLSKKAFLDISVALPPIAEQAAIAAVLSDIDAEIAALEAKKAKAMQIKQGAMQQLLTGKIRLTADTAQKIADII